VVVADHAVDESSNELSVALEVDLVRVRKLVLATLLNLPSLDVL